MYRQLFLVFFMCFILGFTLYGQVGCTDPQAINFDGMAIDNDGSCIYGATQFQMEQKATLPNLLEETSGAAYIDGQLWTHNDGGNSNEIYQIDTLTGEVLQTLLVGNLENEDWEDMAQSDTHLFVGDFGNNLGNRMDLRIGKIDRNDLGNLIVSAELINFSFSDQTDFTERLNDNDYDCEAFFYYQDSLHLFTKNWVDEQTRHYTLPTTPGTHVAQLRETFNTQGLIAGAAIDESSGTISLLGYTPNGVNFMWLLFDYQLNHFFSGNIRKINLGTALTNSQTEGIIFTENGAGFVTSENFIDLTIFPVPFGNRLTLSWEEDYLENGVVEIFDLLGNLVYQKKIDNTEGKMLINTASLPRGSYLVRMSDKNQVVNRVVLRQ